MAEEQQLSSLLPQVMERAGYLQKKSKLDLGNGRGFKFASLEQMLDKVRPELVERGIFIAQGTSRLDRFEIVPSHKQDKDGNPAGPPTVHAVVTVSITLCRNNEGCTFEGTGSGCDTSDKAVMKASSAALKYALQKAFLISWGDDPEADPKVYDEPTEGKEEAPKKASTGRAPKEAEKVDNLIAGIETSDTLEQLALLKPRIRALKDTDKAAYEAAKTAYTAREEKLKG